MPWELTCTSDAEGLDIKTLVGADARGLNFNAYSDQRALFRYRMHTLPQELSAAIGTSTLLAAWNAAKAARAVA